MGNTLDRPQITSSLECQYQLEVYGYCSPKKNYPGLEIYDPDAEAVQVVPVLSEIGSSTILARRQYWEAELAQEEYSYEQEDCAQVAWEPNETEQQNQDQGSKISTEIESAKTSDRDMLALIA